MLVKVPDGTKCKLCGRDLTGEMLQSTSYTCSQCGTHYNYICGQHLCPKCGGVLQDPWTSWNKKYGTNILF